MFVNKLYFKLHLCNTFHSRIFTQYPILSQNPNTFKIRQALFFVFFTDEEIEIKNYVYCPSPTQPVEQEPVRSSVLLNSQRQGFIFLLPRKRYCPWTSSVFLFSFIFFSHGLEESLTVALIWLLLKDCGTNLKCVLGSLHD